MTAPDDYIRRARLAIAGGSSVRSVMSGVAPSVVGTEGVAEAGTTVLQRLEGAGPVLQPLLCLDFHGSAHLVVELRLGLLLDLALFFWRQDLGR